MHFDSVAASAEPAREVRNLRARVSDRVNATVSDRSGVAGVQTVQIGYRGILRSMRSRVAQLAMIEHRSDNLLFERTLDRLVTRFDEIDKALQTAEPEPAVIASIDMLATTVEQLTRLHQIAADRELQELAEKQRQRPRFLAILLLCLAATGLAVWYLVASLVASLRQQEAYEQALLESEQRLHHFQKLDALGRLVGGVAHDFNNWLTVILGHAGLLRDKVGDKDELVAGLDEIEQATLNAVSLTQQLLAFSRRQQFQPRVLNLNELLQGMEEMLNRVITARIELTFSYADDLCDVEVDPELLQQVILNLINNARDAMPDGGQLRVWTERVAVGPDDVRLSGVPAGEYAKLTVSDTGAGMDEETRHRVFEPFFTTKEKGHGTGLGLSTVHGIVTGSNGHIFVESKPGLGSSFILYFPRAEQQDIAASDIRKRAAPQKGVETVLVVEDNEQVRGFVEAGLTSLGYRVLAAADGSQGLDICRNEPTNIDVVLSDVVMPGTSGPKFMATALKLRPDAVAIYMSAYTRDEVLEIRRGDEALDIPLISKPFEMEALSRLIRDRLDRAQRA